MKAQIFLNLKTVRWPIRAKLIAQVYLTELEIRALIVDTIREVTSTAIGVAETDVVGMLTPTTNGPGGAAAATAVDDFYALDLMLLPHKTKILYNFAPLGIEWKFIHSVTKICLKQEGG